MGQVQWLRLGAGLTAGLRVKVVLRVLLRLRVQVRLTVLGMRLGRGITSDSHGELGGQGRHRGREGRQLGGGLRRRNGGRGRRGEGGEVRGRAGQDRAVGADDGLDAGHSVHCPVGSSVLNHTAKIGAGGERAGRGYRSRRKGAG